MQDSNHSARAITGTLIILNIAIAIFTNIATSILPEPIKPYLWLAWPILILLCVFYVYLSLRPTGNQQKLRKPKPTPDSIEMADKAYRALEKFNRASSPEEMKRVIEDHPILLTEGIDSVYEGVIKDVADSGDITAARFFTKRRELLRRSRKVGTSKAFDE